MPPPAKTFRARPSLHFWFLLPLVFMLIVGIWAAVAAEPEKRSGAMAMVGLVCLMILIFYPLIWRIRLRLSPQGVLAAAPLVRLETPWENVAQYYRNGRHAGLVTIRPLTGKGPQRLIDSLDSVNPYDAQEFAWLQQHRYIPLRGFEHAVKSGAVEAAVRAWRPQALVPVAS